MKVVWWVIVGLGLWWFTTKALGVQDEPVNRTGKAIDTLAAW